jgi:hypothetical protein
MRLPWRRLWHRAVSSPDEGIGLVEVIVACTVFGVAVLTIAGALGSGMGLVGHSRQRSAGSGVAQERLERARNVAYENLALNEVPTPNVDSTHPDFNVIDNAGVKKYRLTDGTIEPLVIDAADGGLKHVDDPFELAQTEFTVHQYVTWVDDPDAGDTEPSITGTQSYKRVIAVVTWKFPVHQGPRHTIVESTFVTDGKITIPTASPSPSPGASASPTAPPAGAALGTFQEDGPIIGALPPPSPLSGTCHGSDLHIESGQLLAGAGSQPGYLNTTSVQVRIQGRHPSCTEMWLFLANKTSASDCSDPSGYVQVLKFAASDPPPPVTASWTIPSGDGPKAICAAVQNNGLRAGPAWGVNVVLDQTLPTAPASFQQPADQCEIVGNDRIATFTWSASSDSNLIGYRLYRSVESAAYTVVGQTSALTLTDSSLKSYSSVRYLVRAYDKAGNHSADSAVVSYAKNKC